MSAGKKLHPLAKCLSCCIISPAKGKETDDWFLNLAAIFASAWDSEHLWSLNVRPLSLSGAISRRHRSQNHTSLPPLVVLLFPYDGQSSLGGLSENVFHVLLILCRTLQVDLCVHLLPGLLSLQIRHQGSDCMAVIHVLYGIRTTCGYMATCGCSFWLACYLAYGTFL